MNLQRIRQIFRWHGGHNDGAEVAVTGMIMGAASARHNGMVALASDNENMTQLDSLVLEDLQKIEQHLTITAKDTSTARDVTEKSNSNTDDWEPDIVHIIATRFMQEQPDLLELALARLEVFETFCLPTVANQTTQNFLWIIRMDPKLHPDARNRMINLLKPFQNFYLVASNRFPEGFRDEKSVKDLFDTSKIFSGDLELARRAHHASKNRTVLETRLDADDGLNINFVEQLQYEAQLLLHSQASKKKPQWLIWCALVHVEWHYISPFPSDTNSSADLGELPSGYLVAVAMQGCVTPGLTVGYSAHTDRSSTPKVAHHRLHSQVYPCSNQSTPLSRNNAKEESSRHKRITNCLRRVQLNPSALRTRTPTSAGMSNVALEKGAGDRYRLVRNQLSRQDSLWNIIFRTMTVTSDLATQTKTYLINHLASIAADNLKGQCTKGHSCKKESRTTLRKIAGIHPHGPQLEEYHVANNGTISK